MITALLFLLLGFASIAWGFYLLQKEPDLAPLMVYPVGGGLAIVVMSISLMMK